MKIALAQISPRLGDVEANLQKHLETIAQARAAGAEVVCFPELSLTGYYLRDLTADVAVRPAAGDPVFGPLLAASKDIAVIVGFVEETPRFLYYNSAAYLADGDVVHIHRKVCSSAKTCGTCRCRTWPGWTVPTTLLGWWLRPAAACAPRASV